MPERTYPVHLTAAEVDVLVDAGAYYDTELEDREDDGDAKATRERAALERAFQKLANSGVPMPKVGDSRD